MEAKKHSPLPFCADDKANPYGIYCDDVTGSVVAIVGGAPFNMTSQTREQRIETRDRIIHACNNIGRVTAERDALLELLKIAIDIRKNPQGVSFEATKSLIERAEVQIASVENSAKDLSEALSANLPYSEIARELVDGNRLSVARQMRESLPQFREAMNSAFTMTDDLKTLGIDTADIAIPSHDDMTRTQLLVCLEAHDAHHKDHHDREEKLISIMKRLAEHDPGYETYDRNVYCHFCAAWLSLKEEHKPTCPWKTVKDFVAPSEVDHDRA